MALAAHALALAASLSQAGLVPGLAPLIPDNFTPSTQLGVAYGNKSVELGNLFRVSEVASAPTISFSKEANAPESQLYTLLLVDPDAPTPDDPKYAYWRHWVVSGLKPGHGIKPESALTAYLGPGPKDDSDPHRYLFLLFREPEGLDLSKEDVGGEEFVDRRSFPAAEWTAKHGLELAGVNWMLGAGDGWNCTGSILLMQYDYGNTVEDGEFVLTGMLDKPPAVLLTALARLQARHHLLGNDIPIFYKQALDKYSRLAAAFSSPSQAADVLFVADYRHVENDHNDCDGCDRESTLSREPRCSTDPRVFYGLVASSNQVLRSAARRDALSRRHGILCFEMEAAGLIDILPCLVIRGICDYCDSHKNKQWQGYASMTAVCYAKELLSVIPSNDVRDTETIKDCLKDRSNMLPMTRLDQVQRPSMTNSKTPPPKSVNPGFNGLRSDKDHSIKQEVAPLKLGSAGFLQRKGNLLLICIDLGSRVSTVAWTTTEDFRSYKLNRITSWAGRTRETHQVPTAVAYKNGEVFWGYDIPKDTPRWAPLSAFQNDGGRDVGKDPDKPAGRKLVYDYIAAIFFHVRRTIRNNAMADLGDLKVQAVLVVPSALQSRVKEVKSIAEQALRSDESLASVLVVLRFRAAAVGQLCMVPKPPLGAYVICDMRVNSTDITTYKLATANPVVLERISDAVDLGGVRTSVDDVIEDICRQKLRLSSVYVDSSNLRRSVMTIREDILRPRFEVENPTRKYFIDIRDVLLKGGVPQNYSYEPYLSRGHICLTEPEIATAFNDALDAVKKSIDAQMRLQNTLKIKGIVLVGSWGSNPYVYQHMTSVYTNSYEIPVFQDKRSSHL